MRPNPVLLIAAALAVTLVGCSAHGYPGSISRDVTSAQAESTTNKLIDDALAQIDAAQIRRIDEVRNEASICGDGVSNPTRKIKQWTSHRYVSLVDGADALAILNPIIDSYVANGWTITIDRPPVDLTGRSVQMLDGDADLDTSFGLRLNAVIEKNYIGIASSSPCYDSTRKQ